MWAILVVLFAVVANSAACPSTSPGKPNNQVVKIGYRYDFNWPKPLTMDAVQIQVPSGSDLNGKYLWLHIEGTATSATGSTFYPRASVNVQAANNTDGFQFEPSSDGDNGRLVPDDVYLYLNFSLLTPSFNTSDNTIWITFFPNCDTCVNSLEFALEFLVTNGKPDDTEEPTNIDHIPLQEDIRSWQWQAPSAGASVIFVVQYPAAADVRKLYSSVTVEGSGEIVLYWSKDAPANTSMTTQPATVQVYPDPATTVQGNYQVQVPFTADAAGGTYYMTMYLKRAAISGFATTGSIKSKTGSFPCDSAATTSVSFAAIILMAILSIWHA